MAESEFLTAVANYLDGVGLPGSPKSVGIAEPDASQLPAVVVSLETTQRMSVGLGERTQLVTGGALPLTVHINLANPVLPGDTTVPPLSLVEPVARKVLTLPHGGLVRRNGTVGTLDGNDLKVKVGGVDQTVVSGAPAANQVQAVPAIGQLLFGTALGNLGDVEVSYFIGQWERRVERISGTLRVDICAAAPTTIGVLGGAVLDALGAPAAKTRIVRLITLEVRGISSIGVREQPSTARRRVFRFFFVFEHEVNRAESSGGVIASIPIITKFAAEEPGPPE